MSYLDPGEFSVKYPAGKILGEGAYGKVYVSGTDYVIKEIGGSIPFGAFESAVKELDVYSQMDHPCIIRMANWTYISGLFRIALPLGTSVEDAVDQKKLSFWDVASDILSGMKALYDMNVSHNDIKLDNIVYHEGRVKLIDFGILTPIVEFENTSVMAIYLVTLGYRDPGAHFQYQSDYRFELYSVAGVLATLFGGVSTPFENIPLQQLKFPESEQTSFYSDLIRYPLENRLNINTLFQKYPQLSLRVGTILETPVYPVEEDCNSNVLITVGAWILKVTADLGMKIQTLFLALHLFRRCLPVILPQYNKDKDQKGKIQGLSLACLCLSTIVNDDPSIVDFAHASRLSAKTYTEEEIEELAVNVLITLRCTLFTKTPWNYARTSSELVWGFLNLLRCDYKVNMMADIPTGASRWASRWVRTKDFEQKIKYDLQQAKTDKYSVLIEKMEPGHEVEPSRVGKNYVEETLNINEVNLVIDMFSYKSYPSPPDIYELGRVLSHDYNADSSGETDLVLKKLYKTPAGSRYADIISTIIGPVF
jgi:serine/threonine protein kinase